MIREVDVVSANPFQKRIEYVVNDSCIGYIEYSLMYDRMEIDNFFVNVENRNSGIGSKLMGYLISIAIIERVVNITLEVRVSNDSAKHLYHKFGFREVALRKFYYGDEDGILMEKNIM